MHFITTCAPVPALFSGDNCNPGFIIPFFGLEPLLMEFIIIHHIPQEETSSPDLAASLLNFFLREIFGKRGQDFFILLFSYLFSLQLKSNFSFFFCHHSAANTNRALFAFIISFYTNI